MLELSRVRCVCIDRISQVSATADLICDVSTPRAIWRRLSYNTDGWSVREIWG